MAAEGISGDWSGLQRLVSQLARTGPRIMSRATAEMRAGVTEQYQEDFAAQRSPFGKTWPGSPNNMVLSGALANPTITQSTGTVRLRPERYWVFHQAGTKTDKGGVRMPERALLPFGPSHWDPPIIRRIEQSVEKNVIARIF